MGSENSQSSTTSTLNFDELSLKKNTVPSHAGLVLLYAPNFLEHAGAYLLDKPEASIGRDPMADICIHQQAVSRKHARIIRQRNHWVVQDAGGRNATLLNGRRIHEAPLRNLDEIRIGHAIFKFVHSNAEQYAMYRIDGTTSGEPRSKMLERIRQRGGMIGGYQISRIASEVDAIATSNISVLLRGESGTGKEVLAKYVHTASGRSGGFQAINCAAIPANLIESELFGYKRGAFSGAIRDQIGLVRAAHQGTLFLDEIGDMPFEAQAKLLRLIQTKEMTPLGSGATESVDVRVVCATHQNLEQAVTRGTFRGDLFARINEFAIHLPPLRERKEDLYALCMAFLGEQESASTMISMPFMTAILQYNYPYNVRELESAIRRCAALSKGPELLAEHLPSEMIRCMDHYGQPQEAAPHSKPPKSITKPPAPLAVRAYRKAVSEQDLIASLDRHDGNISAVARELQRGRMQIHRWIKQLGISTDKYR